MKMKGAKWAANCSVSALDHQSGEWKRQARRGCGGLYSSFNDVVFGVKDFVNR